jgi:hypothetical protein
MTLSPEMRDSEEFARVESAEPTDSDIEPEDGGASAEDIVGGMLSDIVGGRSSTDAGSE